MIKKGLIDVPNRRGFFILYKLNISGETVGPQIRYMISDSDPW